MNRNCRKIGVIHHPNGGYARLAGLLIFLSFQVKFEPVTVAISLATGRSQQIYTRTAARRQSELVSLWPILPWRNFREETPKWSALSSKRMMRAAASAFKLSALGNVPQLSATSVLHGALY